MRQGNQGTLGPSALAAAYMHRVYGLLSVAVQQAVHNLLDQNYGHSPSVSRPEAGSPAGWEAWLAADGAEEVEDVWAAEDD